MLLCQFQPDSTLHRREQPELWYSFQHTLHHAHIGIVVFDIKQCHRAVDGKKRRRRRRSSELLILQLQRGASRDRQFNPERAAVLETAVHSNAPAHQFDQPFGERQADARPFRFGAFSSQSLERQEDLLQVFRCNAVSGITHLNAPQFPRWLCRPALFRPALCRSSMLRRETMTRPPSRLYLMALESRLSSTCCKRCRSASTCASSANSHGTRQRLTRHRVAFRQ